MLMKLYCRIACTLHKNTHKIKKVKSNVFALILKKITHKESQTDINPIDAHVGRQLRTRRTLMGLSQEDLAHKVGLTFQQIQKYENGKNRISASRLYEFGICFDVPVAYFFEHIENASDQAASPTSPLRADIFNSKETLELVKAFYGLRNPATRNKLLKMLKSLSAEVKEKS